MRVRLDHCATVSGSFTSGTGALQHTYFNYTTDLKGTEHECDVVCNFTVPTTAMKIRIAWLCTSGTKAHYAAGDFLEVTNLKIEEGDAVTPWTPAPEDVARACDVDELLYGSDYTSQVTFAVASQVCKVLKRGNQVHLQYISTADAVQSYDKLLMTLPEDLHPSTTQFIHLFFGNRSAGITNVGFGIGKVNIDGTVKVDQFSGLIHSGGGSSADSTNTCVYINAVYEL